MVERRKSFRCTTPSEREIGILRNGRTDTMVRILEESAGGLGVLAPKGTQIQPGDRPMVVASTGIIETEVIRARELPEGVRLGLRRIREVPQKRRAFGLPRLSFTNVAVSIVGLAVLGTFVMVANETLQRRNGSDDVALVGGETYVDTRRTLAVEYKQLDGLQSSNISRMLGLTGQQQRQVASVVDELTRRMALLYTRRKGESDAAWAEEGLLLLRDAWLEIEGLLTTEQRAKWQQMAAQRRQT